MLISGRNGLNEDSVLGSSLYLELQMFVQLPEVLPPLLNKIGHAYPGNFSFLRLVAAEAKGPRAHTTLDTCAIKWGLTTEQMGCWFTEIVASGAISDQSVVAQMSALAQQLLDYDGRRAAPAPAPAAKRPAPVDNARPAPVDNARPTAPPTASYGRPVAPAPAAAPRALTPNEIARAEREEMAALCERLRAAGDAAYTLRGALDTYLNKSDLDLQLYDSLGQVHDGIHRAFLGNYPVLDALRVAKISVEHISNPLDRIGTYLDEVAKISLAVGDDAGRAGNRSVTVAMLYNALAGVHEGARSDVLRQTRAYVASRGL